MPWKSMKHVRILSQSNVFYKKLASFPNGDWSLFFLGGPLQETFLSMACIHQLAMVYNDWALALPLGSDICNQSWLVVCSLHHLSRTKFNKTQVEFSSKPSESEWLLQQESNTTSKFPHHCDSRYMSRLWLCHYVKALFSTQWRPHTNLGRFNFNQLPCSPHCSFSRFSHIEPLSGLHVSRSAYVLSVTRLGLAKRMKAKHCPSWIHY